MKIISPLFYGVLYIFILLLYAMPVRAQKENNIWAFSDTLGLDFNSGTPVLMTTKINALESCASVCDASGSLLFYSNGLKVFDKTHTVMPNGSDIAGAAYGSATQGVSISPLPDEPGKYFLFTLDQIEPPGGTGTLHYSLIDMSLNGGKGDVVPGFKNKLLAKDMSEKMVLASSCNTNWLITHDMNKPVFYAWRLTSSSVTPTPIASTTPGLSGARYIMGEMKMSTDCRNVYMVNMQGHLEGFNFDLNTGIVDGYKSIDTTDNAYSIELSADNKKIYVTDFSKILQYDLSLLPDLAAVRASKNVIVTGSYISLRRGPDQKIYFHDGAPGEIARINKPERYGLDCDLEINVPALSHKSDHRYLQFGNSTVVPGGNIIEDTVLNRIDTMLCVGKSALFSRDNTYKGMTWNDGSTAQERVLDKAGRYWRQYRKNCIAYIDTIIVQPVRQPDTIGRKVLDTVGCFIQEMAVETDIQSDQYTWSDGGSGPVSVFRNAGVRWVSALNRQKECEVSIDTFSVSFTDFTVAIPDKVICRDGEATLDAGTTGATNYLWSNGSTQDKIQVAREGKYWVSVSEGNCSKTDTVTVYSHAFELSLGEDMDICLGSRILLSPTVSGSNYIWHDGSTNPTFYATDSGLYTVTVSRDGCAEKAAVHIRYVDCISCMSIPNAFSPNADGVNDVFRVLTRCPVLQFELLIVNRYGSVIFSGKQVTEAWDGTFKGQPQELGVYYFLIRAKFDQGTDVHEELFKGDISLLR